MAVAVEAFCEGVTVEQLDRDPYPIYARLRDEQPVAWMPAVDLWFATSWEAVESVATDPVTFSASVTPSPLDTTFGPGSMLTIDGEPHRAQRNMMMPSFMPRRVDQFAAPLVLPIVEERLAALAGRDSVDLMAEYFEPISVRSLGHVLGLAEIDDDTLRRWFAGLAQGATNFECDPEKQAVGDAASAEISERLAPIFERMWRSPDDSVLSGMLQEAACGDLATRIGAILPTIKLTLLGGMQEPGHGAGSTLAGLLMHDGQWQLLLDDVDAWVPRAVDEGLRWLSPIGTQTRRVTRDVEFEGARLPAGASIGAVISSANRDAGVFGETADDFDITRETRRHAGFGFGRHFCVGHAFSKVQIAIALRALVERYPRLELVDVPEFRGWEFRAPQALHVTLGA
jgi:cytochrome P450